MPVFDGHNDALMKLARYPEAAVERFMHGEWDGRNIAAARQRLQIDLPKARRGSLIGGFFALFPVPEGGGRGGYPPLARADAQAKTRLMAAILDDLQEAGALALCCSADEIRQAMSGGTLAAVFHIEGAEAIGPDLDGLDALFDRGLRSIGIVWSRPNDFGHGVPFRFPASPDIGPGLTEAGKELVRACNRKRILVDLSHLNEKGFWDVAAITDAPLVATHSNVHALCASPRNLTDRQLTAIAESGGMVGLNFATGFLRPDGDLGLNADIGLLLRHLDALVEALGEEGVGFGSDFDGALVPADIRDASGLQVLIRAMLDHGYGRDLVEKIAWRNWVAMLEKQIG